MRVTRNSKPKTRNPRPETPDPKRLLRLAAEQGIAGAQFNLAARYYTGKGIPQDYVLAYMWANLAASQGDEDAVKLRDKIATKMPPDLIAEAQRLAREWKAKGK